MSLSAKQKVPWVMNCALGLKRAQWHTHVKLRARIESRRHRHVNTHSPHRMQVCCVPTSPVCLLRFGLVHRSSDPHLGLPHDHSEQGDYISGPSGSSVAPTWPCLSLLEESSRQSSWFVIWASVSFARGLAASLAPVVWEQVPSSQGSQYCAWVCGHRQSPLCGCTCVLTQVLSRSLIALLSFRNNSLVFWTETYYASSLPCQWGTVFGLWI